jgi:dipeptidase E
MKLFLTSYRIPSPQALFELIGKDPAETKIAIIPNAGDYYAPRARSFKINVTQQYMKSIGFHNEVIDLLEYSDGDKLLSALQQFDAVWVSGGNTFCLREAMQSSGFDKIASKLLRKGVVYCGESAGAVVAGISLKGIESADEPGFAEKVIETGLKLIPFYVLPHADNPNFFESLQAGRALFGDSPYYIELKDIECLVVDGEEMEVIEQES